MSKGVAIVCIYGHPEGYPPTLNCVDELSDIYKRVFLIGRNNLVSDWVYPENCETIYSGKYRHVRETEKMPLTAKILTFLKFVQVLLLTIQRKKPELILIYDPTALFAFYLIRRIAGTRAILWYHNHDFFEESKVRKYSIQWWAGKLEHRMFRNLDIFSLPADERLKHFRMDLLRGKYFLIPNFPSKKFYGRYNSPKTINGKVKLIYQGAISPGHGLEEIIEILNEPMDGVELELVLVGVINESYKSVLEARIIEFGQKDKVRIEPYTPYKRLPAVTTNCHIGIGIYSENTNFHMSLGKASNKIYEYAAVGLPIIVYDSSHYRDHLSEYNWVRFTDLSRASIVESIKSILHQYESVSKMAHEDFYARLNFESKFEDVKRYLIELSSINKN